MSAKSVAGFERVFHNGSIAHEVASEKFRTMARWACHRAQESSTVTAIAVKLLAVAHFSDRFPGEQHDL